MILLSRRDRATLKKHGWVIDNENDEKSIYVHDNDEQMACTMKYVRRAIDGMIMRDHPIVFECWKVVSDKWYSRNYQEWMKPFNDDTPSFFDWLVKRLANNTDTIAQWKEQIDSLAPEDSEQLRHDLEGALRDEYEHEILEEPLTYRLIMK
jgi:hypothetical protein